jgi:hypothetical protein
VSRARRQTHVGWQRFRQPTDVQQQTNYRA